MEVAPDGDGSRLTLFRNTLHGSESDHDVAAWRIQRHRASNGRSYVYTYASKPSLQAVKAKVKAITRCGHNQTLGQLLHRLNPVLRGWCAYFRGGVSGRTFSYLRAYSWRRVTCWLRRKHPKANWRWLKRRYLPRWWPTDGDAVLYNPGSCGSSTTATAGPRSPRRGRRAASNATLSKCSSACKP
jgi:RNA-directed DNA polymerase